MIMQMIEIKEALKNVVMHHKFTKYLATFFNRQNGLHSHALANQVRSFIMDVNFWQCCWNYTYMVEDIMKVL